MPVLLVTGFLGAGKTTLIRRFLGTPEARDTAVVVNEFGEIGIDQALLATAAEGRVALLGNGCLCCTARSDLESTFRALFADRARGAVPPFRRVVLELSGADDPMPVLRTFLAERALAREYHLAAVITVVDAATGAANLEQMPEAARQVAIADRIVVSKSDLAAADAVLPKLRGINPRAPIAMAKDGRLDPDFLLADATVPHAVTLAADAVVHAPGLATFTLRYERPFAWTTLRAALHLLTELRGPDLLRLKGFAAIRECRGPVVVQAVQHVLHPPVELAEWPDADRTTRLVCITRGGLGPAPVASLFEAVAALEPSG